MFEKDSRLRRLKCTGFAANSILTFFWILAVILPDVLPRGLPHIPATGPPESGLEVLLFKVRKLEGRCLGRFSGGPTVDLHPMSISTTGISTWAFPAAWSRFLNNLFLGKFVRHLTQSRRLPNPFRRSAWHLQRKKGNIGHATHIFPSGHVDGPRRFAGCACNTLQLSCSNNAAGSARQSSAAGRNSRRAGRAGGMVSYPYYTTRGPRDSWKPIRRVSARDLVATSSATN